MAADDELDAWRRQWQANEAIPSGLRQKVQRDTRTMRRGRIAEIANSVVWCGGSLALAIVVPRAEIIILAVGIWILVAIAWVTSFALTRGTWAPAAATATSFLELSILRSQRGLQALTAQCVLYVVILAFDLAWIYYFKRESDPWTFLTSNWMLSVWGVSAILAWVAVSYRRRLRRELDNLRALERDMKG